MFHFLNKANFLCRQLSRKGIRRDHLLILRSVHAGTKVKAAETNPETLDEPKEQRPKSNRYIAFQKKLNDDLAAMGQQHKIITNPSYKLDAVEATLLEPWPDNVNPHTGEVDGPAGPEPTRYGDWAFKGRVTDF